MFQMHLRIRRLLAVGTLALVAVAIAGDAAGKPDRPEAAARAELTEAGRAFVRLINDTKRLPRKDVRARRLLLASAWAARKASGRSPCRGLALMRRYERQLKRLERRPPATTRKLTARKQRTATRGMLEADALSVRAALLANPKTRRCGGAREAALPVVRTRLLSSTEREVRLHVTFPQAHFATRRLGGRDWTELVMEGMAPTSRVGTPGVPIYTARLGVPTGANVTVKTSNVSSYLLAGVNLLPHQAQAVDARAPGQPPPTAFLDKRFRIDARAYRSNAPFPAQVGDEGPVGVMRDVRIGGAELAGAQYRPRSRSLRVITGLDVQITFAGDNQGTFGDARLNDPFNAHFNRLYRSTLLNYDVVALHPGPRIWPLCGEEVLIITSPALLPAAMTLRAQKVAEGFVTRIVQTGAPPGGIGTTNAEIQTYVRNRLNGECWFIPSYVILIGNTDHVPTFLVPCGPGGDPDECNIASDMPYVLKDTADYYMDAALGRIPAPDLATANTVVNKIVTYETTSPAPPGDDFFRHFTVTAFFEPTYVCILNEGASGTPNCDGGSPPVTGHWELAVDVKQDARGFTKTAERVRDAMLANGYSVDRLYYADPANDPETYYDGTPMPAAIQKPTFAWDADTTDFVDAFNGGRAIVFHRDHGWPDGWADPTLHEGHLPLLTNAAKLPVTFGINCSSAAYDNPANPSFTEGLLQKPDGGSVGGFGDSRVSGTWANNSISFGFFDALFPNLVPTYGLATPIRRMGDVLVAGKAYLGTADPGAVYGHGHLYGYFGDPTMGLWIAPPVTFDPAKIKADILRTAPPFRKPPGPGPDPPPYWVNVEVTQPEAEGTFVTLEQKGETIGRGIVANGRAVIFPLVGDRPTVGMEVKLQNERFLAATAAVRGQ